MKFEPKLISDDLVSVKPMEGTPIGNLFYMDIKIGPENKEFVLRSAIETFMKNIMWKHCGDERFKPFSVNYHTGEIIGVKYDPENVEEDIYLYQRREK
jgi:hypothetical protein